MNKFTILVSHPREVQIADNLTRKLGEGAPSEEGSSGGISRPLLLVRRTGESNACLGTPLFPPLHRDQGTFSKPRRILGRN